MKNENDLINEAYYKKLEEHHDDSNFPMWLLEESVRDFLDMLKGRDEQGYELVEKIISKHFHKDETTLNPGYGE
jgi:hypothetical protein